jgi:hypothetical protein
MDDDNSSGSFSLRAVKYALVACRWGKFGKKSREMMVDSASV